MQLQLWAGVITGAKTRSPMVDITLIEYRSSIQIHMVVRPYLQLSTYNMAVLLVESLCSVRRRRRVHRHHHDVVCREDKGREGVSCAHVGAATSFGGVSVVVGGFDLSATNDSVFGLIDCYPNDA